MHKKAALQVIFRVISVFFILGGIVRLAANKQTFQSIMIGELWVSHPYFIYIYRVLGAFVVLTGITMFVISQEPFRYSKILAVWGYCFLCIGIVMFLAGCALSMSLLHFAFDFVFCFIVAGMCFLLASQHA